MAAPLYLPPPYQPGYRYTPKDNEFVDQLTRKIAGLPSLIPPHSILEVNNLYDFHPQELAEMYKLDKEYEGCHFFTRRRGTNEFGERMNNRDAKNGFWKCTGGDISVMDAAGQTVAYKKTFAFQERNSPTSFDFHSTNWTMNEFRLSAPHAGDDGTALDLVACRIFKARFEGQDSPQWDTDPDSDSNPTLPDPVNSDTNSEPPSVSESDSSSSSASGGGKSSPSPKRRRVSDEMKHEEGGPSKQNI